MKEPGAAVAGGTCNIDGLFRVRVTAPAAASAAARIAALLAAARRERAPVERLADRLAAVLVPAVVFVAAAAALVWTRRAGLEHGVLVALAVLVVACPCALGIATPIAIWTGLATAARRGVIIRTAAMLERTADIDHVLFDKTGTLTDRTPRLTAIEPAGQAVSAEQLLATAAALEMGISHPLARAILDAWEGQETSAQHLEATGIRAIPGRGVYGEINGEQVAVGTAGFGVEAVSTATCTTADRVSAPPSSSGNGSVVTVSANGQLLGVLRFEETPRVDAAAAISTLRRLGKRINMLSGDRAANAVVPALIADVEAATGLLPEDKVLRIRAARRERSSSRCAVAMVGDGINDAPALAAADVGIAVGSATDLARINADVAVVSDDLERIPWLIEYAGRVTRIVRQNLFWACAYNAVAVGAAAAGALNPLIASLAMLASSVAVVANARRLRHG
jgi:Cu+-exporting ATPase